MSYEYRNSTVLAAHTDNTRFKHFQRPEVFTAGWLETDVHTRNVDDSGGDHWLAVAVRSSAIVRRSTTH